MPGRTASAEETMKGVQTLMERSYIAFISYRHLPLDMWTAKHIHRRIEHYVIPKELRKNGQKKIGYVFRDQDELPISSNLNANIQEALDRSEFLIVICTPETVKSRWVLGEIDYFLKHHARDHILAVLADGTPETSFPPQLTEGPSSEDGSPMERIEPLAANIVADGKAKREKLFLTESLRILAALIGCPYDALYRREIRYRRRRTVAAVSTVFAVAAAFIGLLLNRNAQIRNQLTQTQINESLALASLSQTEYRNGDFQASLRYAMDALPQPEEERPFVPEAEKALSDALQLYRKGELGYFQSFHQAHDAISVDLGMHGRWIATLDRVGVIRVFDIDAGKLLWEEDREGTLAVQLIADEPLILAVGLSGTRLVSAADGSVLWENHEITAVNVSELAEDSGLLLSVDYSDDPEALAEEVCLIKVADGTLLHRLSLPEGQGSYCAASALTENGEEAAVLLQRKAQELADLYYCDFTNGVLLPVAEALPCSPGATAYCLVFTPEGDLALACDDLYGTSALRVYRRSDAWQQAFETTLETEKIAQVVNSSVTLFASVDVFHCWDDIAVFGSKHQLYMLSLKDGSILWSRTLPGTIQACQPYQKGNLALVLSNGIVTFCTDSGVLTHTQNIYSFRGDFGVWLGAARGAAYQDSTFAMVPDAAKRCLTLIRFQDPDWMTVVASRSETGSRICAVSSPSREKIACVEYDAAGAATQWTLLNAVAGVTSEAKKIPDGARFEDPSALMLDEDGVLSLTEEEHDPLTRRLERENDAALQITFKSNGEVFVEEEGSGQLLFQGRFRDQTVSFTAKGIRTDAVFSDDGSRLLLFFDDSSAAAPVCMVLETENYACIGCFEGMAAYLPGRDSVLITPYLGDVYLSPFWNREEIMQKASAILGEE